MPDIITTGISIDTRAAVTALDRLTAAGATAGRAADVLTSKVDSYIAGVSKSNAVLGQAIPATNAAAAAHDKLGVALGRSAAAHKAHGHAVVNANMAMQEAGHVFRAFADVTIATGNPLMALRYEFGRIADLASGPRGLAVFVDIAGQKLANFGKIAGSVLSPLTLVGAGIAGTAAIAIGSYAMWASAQDKLFASLQGKGRASGLNYGSLDAIAAAAAPKANLSLSQARSIAAQMASTGLAGGSTIAGTIPLTRAFSRASGLGIEEAGKTLGADIAEPGKGIEDLQKKVGGYSDATTRLVQTLDAQGDRLGAQNALLKASADNFGNASTRVRVYREELEQLGHKVGGFFDRIGENIAAAFGDETVAHRIQMLKDLIARNAAQPRGLDASILDSSTRDAQKELASLQEGEFQLKQRAAEFDQLQRSHEVGSALRDLLPDEMRRQELLNKRTNINRYFAPNSPANANGWLTNTSLNAYGQIGATPGQINDSRSRLDDALSPLAMGAARITQESRFANDAISALTGSERTATEALRARTEALNQARGAEVAAAEAAAVWTRAVAETEHTLREANIRSDFEAGAAGLRPVQAEAARIRFRYGQAEREGTWESNRPPFIGPPRAGGISVSGPSGSQPAPIDIHAALGNIPTSAASIRQPYDDAMSQLKRLSHSGTVPPPGPPDVLGIDPRFVNTYGAAPQGQTKSYSQLANRDVLTAYDVAMMSIVRRQKDSLDAESAIEKVRIDTLGKSAQIIGQETTRQTLLNEAHAEGIDLLDKADPRVRRFYSDLDSLSAQAGRQAADLDRMQKTTAALDFTRSAFRDTTGSLATDLFTNNKQSILAKLSPAEQSKVLTGKESMTSARFSAAGRDIQSMLSQKLIGSGLDMMTAGIFGKSGQPGGGLIGTLLGKGIGALFGGGGSAGSDNWGIGGDAAASPLSGIGSWLSNLFHFAEGGPVWGSGGPRSDNVRAMLSPGEYVINARSTSRFRPMLDRINHYADGGIVAPSSPSFGGGGGMVGGGGNTVSHASHFHAGDIIIQGNADKDTASHILQQSAAQLAAYDRHLQRNIYSMVVRNQNNKT